MFISVGTANVQCLPFHGARALLWRFALNLALIQNVANVQYAPLVVQINQGFGKGKLNFFQPFVHLVNNHLYALGQYQGLFLLKIFK